MISYQYDHADVGGKETNHHGKFNLKKGFLISELTYEENYPIQQLYFLETWTLIMDISGWGDVF